jgi:hypothetical protein
MTGDGQTTGFGVLPHAEPLPTPGARIGIRITYVISTSSVWGASSSRRPSTKAPTCAEKSRRHEQHRCWR